MVKHWLDKYIKQQKGNRKIIESLLGKKAGEIQERAEFENWDAPKKKMRR